MHDPTQTFIARVIGWSAGNPLLVSVFAVLILAGGILAIGHTPLDAIPDLSDTQVIIRTDYEGQSPQLIEDTVTYPLSSAMLGLPRAKVVRGFSMFGASFVYVIFQDGTDVYWARSRVLEALSRIQSGLPAGANTQIGPDATGVGWVYQYALVSRCAVDKRVGEPSPVYGRGAEPAPAQAGGEGTGQRFRSDSPHPNPLPHAGEGVISSGKCLDLAQLRALQDWFLRFELATVPGVSEVASVGGFVKEYQVLADPVKLRAYNIPLSRLAEALQSSSREAGGRVIEQGETEFVVRSRGYVTSVGDLEKIVLKSEEGTPVKLADVARIIEGPELRRGVTELNGEGEAPAGIIIMRPGGNALTVITAIKAKIESLKPGLPEGVEIVPVYDRAPLIEGAVSYLTHKLVEEAVVVALVCLIFLLHARSSFVAIVTLPLGVLAAFIVMQAQGITANIMSLGGIAIAIGAMVDASIVMVENAHRKLSAFSSPLAVDEPSPVYGRGQGEGASVVAGSPHPNPLPHAGEGGSSSGSKKDAILQAAQEVGPGLFFSLLIITVSFLPVFAMTGQSARLFAPLAFTKTYSMAAAAILSVTVVPLLMLWLIRGRILPEEANPINRFFIRIYKPILARALKHGRATLLIATMLLLSMAWPVARTGSEFMPALYEGDLLYMPTTLPGVSVTKAKEILQITNRAIKTVPEVETVFGKAGQAETATDPAPISMIETWVHLKPKAEWRKGMTTEKLIKELDSATKIPGLVNSWGYPIKIRMDMVTTGIRTPVGIKISGGDLKTIGEIAQQVEQAVKDVSGTRSAFADRVVGAKYLEIVPDRDKLARYNMDLGTVQEVIATALGGLRTAESVQGRERYGIMLRYDRPYRETIGDVGDILVAAPSGAQIPLKELADIHLTGGSQMIVSENARLNGWVFVDIAGRDIGGYVREAQKIVAEKVKLPAGYSIGWSGQFEQMLEACARLNIAIPATIAIIFVLLVMHFGRLDRTLMVMLSLPFGLIGGAWTLYLAQYNFSVAVAVGFIALAGIAVETAVVMLIYLDQQVRQHPPASRAELFECVMHGAVLRVRPKLMTVSVIIAGLLPVFMTDGLGADVMRRIALPMVGGMISTTLLTLIVIPVVYYRYEARRFLHKNDVV